MMAYKVFLVIIYTGFVIAGTATSDNSDNRRRRNNDDGINPCPYIGNGQTDNTKVEQCYFQSAFSDAKDCATELSDRSSRRSRAEKACGGLLGSSFDGDLDSCYGAVYGCGGINVGSFDGGLCDRINKADLAKSISDDLDKVQQRADDKLQKLVDKQKDVTDAAKTAQDKQFELQEKIQKLQDSSKQITLKADEDIQAAQTELANANANASSEISKMKSTIDITQAQMEKVKTADRAKLVAKYYEETQKAYEACEKVRDDKLSKLLLDKNSAATAGRLRYRTFADLVSQNQATKDPRVLSEFKRCTNRIGTLIMLKQAAEMEDKKAELNILVKQADSLKEQIKIMRENMKRNQSTTAMRAEKIAVRAAAEMESLARSLTATYQQVQAETVFNLQRQKQDQLTLAKYSTDYQEALLNQKRDEATLKSLQAQGITKNTGTRLNDQLNNVRQTLENSGYTEQDSLMNKIESVCKDNLNRLYNNRPGAQPPAATGAGK